MKLPKMVLPKLLVLERDHHNPHMIGLWQRHGHGWNELD